MSILSLPRICVTVALNTCLGLRINDLRLGAKSSGESVLLCTKCTVQQVNNFKAI